jgi:hypothetical protein
MKSVKPDIASPHRPDDFYRWLEVRHGGRKQCAAASNVGPDGVEQIRKALFELVDHVVDEPAYT